MWDQQVEKGKRLHDRAVFEFFARLGSIGALWIGKTFGLSAQNKGKSGLDERMAIKRSSRIPA